MRFLPRELDAEALRVLRHHWRVAGVRPVHVAVPALLALLAAGLEGASYSLLLPLRDALTEGGFAFLEGSRAFGWILHLVPDAPRRDAYLVVAILTLVLVFRSLKLATGYARSVYMHRRDERSFARVQGHALERVLGFGRQYFDRRSLGRLEVELGWPRAAVELVHVFEEFLRRALTAVAKAVVMALVSLPLFVIVAVGYPVVVWAMRLITRRIARLAHEGVAVEVRTKEEVLELLSSIPLVKAMNQERGAAQAYRDLLDEGRRIAVRRRNAQALRWPVEEILVLGSVIVVQIALILASDSFAPADLADLAIFLLLVQQILPDLQGIGNIQMALAQQKPRLQALARMMSDDEKHVVSSGSRTFDGLRRGIEVRDLTFAYTADTPVLKEVSAFVPAGRLTAVVGGSGAGKSTFVDIIARFYECPPGTVFLDGVDIREFSLSSLYRHMGIVSQEVWILNRTVRENLVYGLDRPPADTTLLEILEEVRLGDLGRGETSPLDVVLGDRGVQLSGGQRQRIALARALLRDAEILILDEATSALDSVVEREITTTIRRRFEGRTLVVIAHRLSTLRGADHVLVFRDGRIVERGGWDELLDGGGEFARLHRAQFEEEDESGRTERPPAPQG